MADFQNLFTQVQAVTTPHAGVPLAGPDNHERIGKPFLLHLAGRLGNAQIGPICALPSRPARCSRKGFPMRSWLSGPDSGTPACGVVTA